MMIPILVLLTAAAGLQAQEGPTASDDLKISKAVSPSLVRVEYTLQYDKGEAPSGAGWADRCASCGNFHYSDASQVVDEERPLEAAGFLLSPTRVITRDILMHPRFIKGTAVRFGDKTVPARIVATAQRQNAAILELEKPLENAVPLTFDSTKKGPFRTVKYGRHNASWTINVQGLSGPVTSGETHAPFRSVPSNSLIVDLSGTPVGISMNGELPLDDSWKGSPLKWPAMNEADMAKAVKELERRSARALPRVSLSFRSPKKGQADPFSGYSPGMQDPSATELKVLGLLLDEKRILVLTSLTPRVTARLTRIMVHLPEGDPVPATFAGTLEDYGAFVATLERAVPGAPELSGQSIHTYRNKLILSAKIVLQGEKRVSYFEHGRIPSFEIGWKRQAYPTLTGDSTNAYIFDARGALLAFPLARRMKGADDMMWRWGATLLTPSAHIKQLVTDGLAGHFDANNIPLSEEEENRLAWMGVELQPLNQQLARAKDVSDLTNDGASGALVAYVYPDSPASRAGIKPGHILLRLHSEDRPKPIELNLQTYGYRFGPTNFPWDRLDEMPEQYFDSFPSPWPSVENSFTRLLTDLGFGKKYTAEIFHEGKTLKMNLVVEQGPARFESAPRHKSEALGLTVCGLTYEVRRYFRKTPDDPAVIIAKIEMASKASVAGLKPYEIITHVNDEPVKDEKEFEKLVGKGGTLRLSILRMTRTRQVRIKLDAPDEGEKEKPEKPEKP